MRDPQKEVLSDIHHQAGEIQRLVVLMLSQNKIGRDWLLDMKHAHERLDLLVGRINS